MKLRKILLASAMVAAMTGVVATSAMAMTAEWDPETESVIITDCPTTAPRKTLLVLETQADGSALTTIAEKNIKQIDEQAAAYTTVKVGPLKDGKYQVKVGGAGDPVSAFFTVSSNPYASSTRLLGDISGDNQIGLEDAGLAINHELGASKLKGESLQAGDVNNDLSVGLEDAGFMINYELNTDRVTIDGKKAVKDREAYIPES